MKSKLYKAFIATSLVIVPFLLSLSVIGHFTFLNIDRSTGYLAWNTEVASIVLASIYLAVLFGYGIAVCVKTITSKSKKQETQEENQ